MLKRFRDAGLLRISALVLAAFALLVGLGTWQWRRKAWKEDLVSTIAARLKAEPADNAAFSAMRCAAIDQVGLAGSCEYLPVKLTGTFDHANERHVYAGIEKPAGGVGGQGYWIMTPFKLAPGGAEAIAVSRGFVPDTGMSRRRPRKDADRWRHDYHGVDTWLRTAFDVHKSQRPGQEHLVFAQPKRTVR